MKLMGRTRSEGERDATATLPNPVDVNPIGLTLGVSRPVVIAACWCLCLLVIGFTIYQGGRLVGHFAEVTVPFFVAVLLAALLTPFRRFLLRHHVPAGLATAATMIGTLLFIGGLITLTGTQFARGFRDLSTEVGAGLERIQDWLATGPLHVSSSQLQTYLDQLQAQVMNNRDRLTESALQASSAAGSTLTGLVLSLFILIFLLHDGERVWRWVLSWAPAGARDAIDLAGRRGWVTVTSYVRATITVAAVDAFGIGVGAAILGVPLAIPIAVLVFLSAFIPMLGAILSGAVAVLVALVALGPVQALIMLGIVIGVQQLESHVLQPLLLGRAVNLHPLGVVLSLGAGFIVAGILGGIFAVPLMAFLNTVRHSLRHAADEDPAEPDTEVDAPLAEPAVDEEPAPAEVTQPR